MRIVAPSFEVISLIDNEAMLKRIEAIGRVCYKSENLMTQESAAPFIRNIISRGHESVIEHEAISVKIICDRGVTHEIVRHRIASYSQESTRYCNYFGDKFGSELTFIRPYFWAENSSLYSIWAEGMQAAEKSYLSLIAAGAKPEEARSVLPNSLKTEIVVTMNLREWRHFFKLRTSKAAHPQIREISIPILNHFKTLLPAVFEDIIVDGGLKAD